MSERKRSPSDIAGAPHRESQELPSQFCNANICVFCRKPFEMGITVLRVDVGWVHPECAERRAAIAQKITNDKDRINRECADERRVCRL